ncbi:glycosyltransferase family 2 protein [Hyphomonas sp.]|uniref:glycosyltransferase family 2 protein n=1 Tax=Hyphomonas sp. TaxID=87 RepID=UPI00391DA779
MAADGEGFFERADGPGGRGLVEPPPDRRAAHAAAFGLLLRQPGNSAARTLSAGQRRLGARGFALIGAAVIAAPEAGLGLAGLAGLVVFAAILVFRIWLYAAGLQPGRRAACWQPEAEDAWPVYTLLIALKDEAETAPQLAAAIRALDYPVARLDVKLLIETGDEATALALRRERWPPGAELMVVPPGLPRTKPRALNYGLARARGEFVVVYDAEDRPHPDQLKAAVSAFRQGPAGLACVQAPLAGQGARGWIAGQWALEYAVQFGRVLPGQVRLGLPVMLGGTSNHFRRDALLAAGGWDAWNVTEDADLGLRLARSGLRVGLIAPPTQEAPPEDLLVWINQRSRWLKGFLQTWLVVMRRPGAAAREMGLAGFVSVQLTLGAAILSALVHGPWAMWLALMAIVPGTTMATAFAALAAASYAAGIAMALLAPGPKGWRRWMLAASLPLYWPLQSIAMARALYGLAKCPHFWAKTPHRIA